MEIEHIQEKSPSVVPFHTGELHRAAKTCKSGPDHMLFAEIDHEIISTAILLPSQRRRVVVSYKEKYVHEVVVNFLVKLAKEKSVVT